MIQLQNKCCPNQIVLRFRDPDVVGFRTQRNSVSVHDRGELFLRFFAVRIKVENIVRDTRKTFVGEFLKRKRLILSLQNTEHFKITKLRVK